MNNNEPAYNAHLLDAESTCQQIELEAAKRRYHEQTSAMLSKALGRTVDCTPSREDELIGAIVEACCLLEQMPVEFYNDPFVKRAYKRLQDALL